MSCILSCSLVNSIFNIFWFVGSLPFGRSFVCSCGRARSFVRAGGRALVRLRAGTRSFVRRYLWKYLNKVFVVVISETFLIVVTSKTLFIVVIV